MAATYKIAHLRERGQDMIIVPLDDSFQNKSSQAQGETELALQRCASSAGLRGTVCLVWMSGGRFYFIAPRQWHEFFKSIGMGFVMQNINRELTCG